MGSIDATAATLDDFKPWTAFNQSYVDTFDADTKALYN